MPPWPKNGPAHGQMLKHEKIFLSETIWPRVLIFSMLHHLVDLYQVFQIMPLGPKLAPTLGVTCFLHYRLTLWKTRQKCSCLIPYGKES